MKRSALLAILLALSLAACGEKPAEEAAESAPAAEATETAPAPESAPAASAPEAAATQAAPAEEPAASEKNDSDESAQH